MEKTRGIKIRYKILLTAFAQYNKTGVQGLISSITATRQSRLTSKMLFLSK